MSILNINRNVFLEKEELVRFQEFLRSDTISQVFLDNTISFGIVRSEFVGPDLSFKIETGTNAQTIKIANLSKAVDIDRLLIRQIPIDNISVPTGGYYWVKISHKYNNLEVGDCSINVNGEVVGVNTLFTDVLRGQATEVPVKIKFYKTSGLVNTAIYEVVDVTDNLNISLSGTSFVAESGLRYIVIGATPLGETITSDQEDGLYQYDDCNIEFVAEEVLDTPPVTDFVENKEFYVARVLNSGGVITIEDKREDYWEFFLAGLADKLDKDANLSDLTDVAAARANLGILSTQELEAAYFHDSGWKAMARGVAANAANFDLKLRRIGKLCTIQGTFKDGTNTSPNAIIATILLSDFALPSGTYVRPSAKIYFYCGVQVSTANYNRGMHGYVKLGDPGDFSLYLMVDMSDGLGNDGTTKFNINISFFVD